MQTLRGRSSLGGDVGDGVVGESIVEDVLVESSAEEVPVVLSGRRGTVTAGHDNDVRRFGARELDAFEEVLEFVVRGGE